MNLPEARDAYLKTLGSVAAIAGASGWLESETTRIYHQIRSAAYEDNLKLCFDGTIQRPCSNAEFDAEAAANLEFARRRGSFTLNELAQLSMERFFAIDNRGAYSLT